MFIGYLSILKLPSKVTVVREARRLRDKLPAYASEVHFFEMLHNSLSHLENGIEI